MRNINQKIYDNISPFEEFMRLFDTHRNNMFTIGSGKQFRIKTVFFVLFLMLFKFAFGNILPSFVNILILIVVCFLILEGILGFFKWLNNSAQKQGLFGIIKCFLGLVVLIFLL